MLNEYLLIFNIAGLSKQLNLIFADSKCSIETILDYNI